MENKNQKKNEVAGRREKNNERSKQENYLARRDCDLFEVIFRHLLEGTSENQEEPQSSLRPGRVSIQAPPEYKYVYRASPLDQPLRCQSFKTEQCNRDYSS